MSILVFFMFCFENQQNLTVDFDRKPVLTLLVIFFDCASGSYHTPF